MVILLIILMIIILILIPMFVVIFILCNRRGACAAGAPAGFPPLKPTKA